MHGRGCLGSRSSFLSSNILPVHSRVAMSLHSYTYIHACFMLLILLCLGRALHSCVLYLALSHTKDERTVHPSIWGVTWCNVNSCTLTSFSACIGAKWIDMDKFCASIFDH